MYFSGQWSVCNPGLGFCTAATRTWCVPVATPSPGLNVINENRPSASDSAMAGRLPLTSTWILALGRGLPSIKICPETGTSFTPPSLHPIKRIIPTAPTKPVTTLNALIAKALPYVLP